MKLGRLVTIYKLAADTGSSLTDTKKKSGLTDYIGDTGKKEDSDRKGKFNQLISPVKEYINSILSNVSETLDREYFIKLIPRSDQYDVLKYLIVDCEKRVRDEKISITTFEVNKSKTEQNIKKYLQEIEKLKAIIQKERLKASELEVKLNLATDDDAKKLKADLRRKNDFINANLIELENININIERLSENLVRINNTLSNKYETTELKTEKLNNIISVLKKMLAAYNEKHPAPLEKEEKGGPWSTFHLPPEPEESAVTGIKVPFRGIMEDNSRKSLEPPVDGKTNAIQIVILKSVETSTAKREQGFVTDRNDAVYKSNPVYLNPSELSQAKKSLERMVGSATEIADSNFPINKFVFPTLPSASSAPHTNRGRGIQTYNDAKIVEAVGYVWENDKWKEIFSVRNGAEKITGLQDEDREIGGFTREDPMLDIVRVFSKADAEEIMQIAGNIVAHRQGSGGGKKVWSEPPALANARIEKQFGAKLEEMSNEMLKFVFDIMKERLKILNDDELQEQKPVNKIIHALNVTFSPKKGNLQFNNNKKQLSKMVNQSMPKPKSINDFPLFADGIYTEWNLSDVNPKSLSELDLRKIYDAIIRLIIINHDEIKKQREFGPNLHSAPTGAGARRLNPNLKPNPMPDPADSKTPPPSMDQLFAEFGE